jgi:hypothetical protein
MQTNRCIAYPARGGAYRIMLKSILSEIDAEISRLEQAKALLSSAGTAAIKRKPGKPPKTASVRIPKVQKTKKRRKLSAEARERIRQAQIKRWAAVKQAAKPDANAAAVASPQSKKKATKAAA